MAYLLKNLKNPGNTQSGIADFALIALVSDFEEGGIMVPTAPFANPGDEVRILTAHTFKADKGFAKFQLAPEKNSLEGKTIGDLGFQKFDFELKIFVAGSYANVHEAMKNLINQPLIVLAKDSNCPANMHYQLGGDCVYAYLKGDFTTGTTKDGVKGYNCTVSYQGPYVQLYAAGIPTILAD